MSVFSSQLPALLTSSPASDLVYITSSYNWETFKKKKIMASGPTPPWHTDGGKVETVTDFIFLGFKITTDGDCSHEIKRHLLPGRKAMTNLDSILKSRGISFPTKACIVKATVFSVIIYKCESWTIKKARAELMLFNCGAGEDS